MGDKRLHVVSAEGDVFDPQALSLFQELDLNPRQKLLLRYLGRQRRVTSRDFQELCPDVHAETLRRDLADLVSKGALIKVGDKKATYYILKR